MGSNGAGKSTLTKIMSGLVSQDEGRVLYYGYELEKNYGNLKKFFSVVPQEISCYSGFTVKENVDFFGKMHGKRGEELRKKTKEILDWLMLSEFSKRPANELSGGYKRLLNIACSVVGDPSIIFMDEPTVGLDPNMRHMLWEKIFELQEQNKTICLTTHYLEEAQELCDHVGLLMNGRLIIKGAPPDLIKKYGGQTVLITKTDRQVSDEHAEKIKKIFEVSQTVIIGNSIVISFPQEQSLEQISILSDWLKQNGYKVTSSVVKEPDLEDVFLNITGEKLKVD